MPDARPPAPALHDPPARSSTSSPPAAFYPAADGDDEHDLQFSGDVSLREEDWTGRRTLQESRLAGKRRELLTALFGELDFLVYVELAALYYLDTSTFLFILRIVTHVAPLQSVLATLAAAPRPRSSHASLGLVALANAVAVGVHLLGVQASAGEATRFDLHGHLFIDLIGQRCPPTGWPGRMRLVAMDLAVLALQVLALGAAAELDRRGWAPKARQLPTIDGPTDVRAALVAAASTIDEAQAGRVGAAPAGLPVAEDVEGIEMQPMPRRRAPVDTPLAIVRDEDVQIPLLPVAPSGATTDDTAQSASRSPETAFWATMREVERVYAGHATLVAVDPWHMLRTEYYDRVNRRAAGRV